MTAEVTIQNRIVCAANKYPDGTLILGARHFDGVMHKTLKAYPHLNVPDYRRPTPIQGFIDKYGTFHDRKSAWKIANVAGQIIRRVGGDDGVLYSENLY